VIQPEVQRITVDGQGKAIVDAPDARQPAIQVVGREITIKGFTITGGFTGVAINRGATALVENNTIERAAEMGVEVSQNSIIRDNGGDGIQVLRASTARIIGNTVTGNRLTGLSVEQTSHADVAGNEFSGNGEYAIRVAGNSGVNLADSAMGLFPKPNTTTAPNGMFGVRCELGAYLDGPLGSLGGRQGVKDVTDASCIDHSRH